MVRCWVHPAQSWALLIPSNLSMSSIFQGSPDLWQEIDLINTGVLYFLTNPSGLCEIPANILGIQMCNEWVRTAWCLPEQDNTWLQHSSQRIKRCLNVYPVEWIHPRWNRCPCSHLEWAEGIEAVRYNSKSDRKARKGRIVPCRNHQPLWRWGIQKEVATARE